MNEEEKALVGKFQNLYIKDFKGEPITSDDRLNYIECALITNLIEKLDKELNNLKEIEKSHQEENGKLRVEFEKVYEDNLTLAHEKEKNKDLEEKLKIAVAMLTKGTYPEENEGDNDFDKQFIAVDKIKEKIELLKDILKAKEKDGNIYKQIPIEYLKGAIEQLEELLEEKNGKTRFYYKKTH